MDKNKTPVVYKETVPGIRRVRGEAPYLGDGPNPAPRATKRQLGGAALLGRRGGTALLGEKGGVYSPGDNDYPDDQGGVLDTLNYQQDTEAEQE